MNFESKIFINFMSLNKQIFFALEGIGRKRGRPEDVEYVHQVFTATRIWIQKLSSI